MGPSILGIFIALSSILFLAYVTTRYIGGKTKKAAKGNYINVVESVSMGMDKQLHLVKVGEQFILISSSGKNIQFMTNIKLDGFEIDADSDNKNVLFDFKGLFDKYIQVYKERKNNKSVERDNTDKQFGITEGEVFKTNLNKLKSITSLMNKKGKKDGDESTNEK